ncbi:hypothetical protein GOBAR_AA04950 [Gossypium barbadense]|uniref:Uncharacterized protein n=1 Tax=Gossypium barbadense TaxID=3634 RepID=A0A2P5YJ71_GOSBA|nr:hypothetical protein GOBAR_AA04950 [Gossypium barbadense]
MSSSRGKKTVVPTSKKRKGAVSSSGPTTEIRHLFLQVPLGPQEELYQILWARPLGVDRCIDWATLEQIQLVDATVMTNFDDPGMVQFCLGGLIRQLSRDLVPASATYDPSRSKASALPPFLRYLHAILAHALTGR